MPLVLGVLRRSWWWNGGNVIVTATPEINYVVGCWQMPRECSHLRLAGRSGGIRRVNIYVHYFVQPQRNYVLETCKMKLFNWKTKEKLCLQCAYMIAHAQSPYQSEYKTSTMYTNRPTCVCCLSDDLHSADLSCGYAHPVGHALYIIVGKYTEKSMPGNHKKK